MRYRDLEGGDKLLVATVLDEAMAKPEPVDLTTITPSTHEEADSRILLHVAHAAASGHRNIFIRTSDSDVVVLSVYAAAQLGQGIDELWIGFGTGRNFRYHSMVDSHF